MKMKAFEKWWKPEEEKVIKRYFPYSENNTAQESLYENNLIKGLKNNSAKVWREALKWALEQDVFCSYNERLDTSDCGLKDAIEEELNGP